MPFPVGPGEKSLDLKCGRGSPWNMEPSPSDCGTEPGAVPFVGHFYALHKSVLKDEMQKEEGEPNRELVQLCLRKVKKEKSNLSEITNRALPESCSVCAESHLLQLSS